jgi:tetratricopeptide (TPR) repeat protein
MADILTSYETGFSLLLKRMGHGHPHYAEALTLQARLLENLGRARRYGDTETNRTERAEVVDMLNSLAMASLGKSFDDLCQESAAATLEGSGAMAQGPGASAAGAGGVVVGGDVFGSVIVTGDGNVVGVDHRQREVERARATGDLASEGAALGNLGTAYAARGDFSQAVEHYEKALAIARKLGDLQTEAIYLQNLGLALVRLADAEPERRQEYLSRASNTLRQAMELFDALGSAPIVRARIRYHVGRCYSWLGRWREAIALLEQARETFSQHKTRPELASTLLELGQLYHMTHDFESAHLYLKDALRLFRRLQDTDGVAVTQEALGNLALQTAHPSEAIVSLQEARQGYVALQRDERIQAIDELLRIANKANPPLVDGENQS